jgi:hypothetical protein
MNRTRRPAALTFVAVPALALGPAVAAHASPATAPGAASRASCNVERESNGKYHLGGSGSEFGVRTAHGKTTLTCAKVDH